MTKDTKKKMRTISEMLNKIDKTSKAVLHLMPKKIQESMFRDLYELKGCGSINKFQFQQDELWQISNCVTDFTDFILKTTKQFCEYHYENSNRRNEIDRDILNCLGKNGFCTADDLYTHLAEKININELEIAINKLIASKKIFIKKTKKKPQYGPCCGMIEEIVYYVHP